MKKEVSYILIICGEYWILKHLQVSLSVIINFASNQIFDVSVTKIYTKIEFCIFNIKFSLAVLHLNEIFLLTLILVYNDSIFLFSKKVFQLHLLFSNQVLLNYQTPYVKLLYIVSTNKEQRYQNFFLIFGLFPSIRL